MIIDNNSCLPGSFFAEPSEAQKVLNRIPQDGLVLIFSRLSLNEISNLRLCSRSWSCASTNYIKTHILALPNLFVSFLSENKLELSGLSEEGSLLEISDRLLKARDKLVDVLKVLDRVSLFKLEGESKSIPKPIFFEKLFDLTRLMRSIYSNWRQLGRATLELTYLGCSNKAFKLLNDMPDVEVSFENWHYDASKSMKFATFCLRIRQHSCMGLFDKIVEVAKSLINQDGKFITFDHEADYLNSLKVICEELVKANKRERADEVLNLIPSMGDQKTVLEKMNETKWLGRSLDKLQINNLQLIFEIDCESVRMIHRLI